MCIAAIVSKCDIETRVDIEWSSFGKHDRPWTTLQLYHCRRAHAYTLTSQQLTSFSGEAVGEVRPFLAGLSGEAAIRIDASRWLALRIEHAVKFAVLDPTDRVPTSTDVCDPTGLVPTSARRVLFSLHQSHQPLGKTEGAPLLRLFLV